VLEEVDNAAQKLADDAKAKLVEWETKLVKLADGSRLIYICAVWL